MVDFVFEMEKEEFSPEETEEILRRGEEAKKGINLSPPFQSLQEALDWYKNSTFSPTQLKEIVLKAEETDQGINASPSFTSTKEAIAWLKTAHIFE